jgi:hypothetical protein
LAHRNVIAETVNRCRPSKPSSHARSKVEIQVVGYGRDRGDYDDHLQLMPMASLPRGQVGGQS